MQLCSIAFRILLKLGLPPKSKGLLKELENASVFTIAATDSEGIDFATLDKEQLVEEVRRELERDRGAQKDGQALHVQNRRRSNSASVFYYCWRGALGDFVPNIPRSRKKVYPFMVLQTKGQFLGRISPESCHVVVMNDKTPEERVLTAAELNLAKRLWG